MRRPWAAAVLVTVVFVTPQTTRADSDSHYQDTLLGARAAGMGGASIALANEATGSFYNPAGIVVDKSTLIQVSMSAYRWRRKKLTVLDACGKSLEEDEGGFFGFPASVGFVKPFGSKLRQAVGIALLVPFMSKRSQAYLVDDADCGGQLLDMGGSNWLVDRVFQGTLSYAIRPLPWLQLGVSLGFAVRDLSVAGLNSTVVRPSGGSDSTVSLSYSEAEVTIWNLYAQFGAIVEPLEGLRLGVSITTPHVRLTGQGRLDLLESLRDPTDPSQSLGQGSLLTYDDAEYHWKVPMALGLGVAYQRPRFAVAADVKLHLPVSRYAAIRHPTVSSTEYDVERKLVVNVNVGGELWVLPDKLALRAGFFTNFSSEPAPDEQALVDGEERINLFGATFGGAYRTNDASLVTFALQFMYGSGDRAQLRLRGDGQQGLLLDYQKATATDLSILISIGGAVDLD